MARDMSVRHVRRIVRHANSRLCYSDVNRVFVTGLKSLHRQIAGQQVMFAVILDVCISIELEAIF